jgi:hypothetical protein
MTIVRKVLIASVLLASSPVLAMDDKQYEYLESLDRLCLRRTQWNGGDQTYEKGFARCAELQRAFIEEFRRRQAENVQEDLADIAWYFQLYPTRVAKRP